MPPLAAAFLRTRVATATPGPLPSGRADRGERNAPNHQVDRMHRVGVSGCRRVGAQRSYSPGILRTRTVNRQPRHDG